jgi:hypothetical protein
MSAGISCITQSKNCEKDGFDLWVPETGMYVSPEPSTLTGALVPLNSGISHCDELV